MVALQHEHGSGLILQIYDIKRFFDKENIRDAMDTLNDIKVKKEVYRTWYKLNKNTRISVKTGVGETEEADVGELVGQGSSGGAIVSQVKVDHGLNRYFCGSRDEANYGVVRMQPMSFRDDIL